MPQLLSAFFSDQPSAVIFTALLAIAEAWMSRARHIWQPRRRLASKPQSCIPEWKKHFIFMSCIGQFFVKKIVLSAPKLPYPPAHLLCHCVQVESLLASSGVATMCVPATYEAFPTWKGGLGFSDMPKHQLTAAKAFMGLLMFPGTHMLSKALLPGQETLGLDERGNPIEPSQPSGPTPSAPQSSPEVLDLTQPQKAVEQGGHSQPSAFQPGDAPAHAGELPEPGEAAMEAGDPSSSSPHPASASIDPPEHVDGCLGQPAASSAARSQFTAGSHPIPDCKADHVSSALAPAHANGTASQGGSQRVWQEQSSPSC